MKTSPSTVWLLRDLFSFNCFETLVPHSSSTAHISARPKLHLFFDTDGSKIGKYTNPFDNVGSAVIF